jgi:hypothetical protein
LVFHMKKARCPQDAKSLEWHAARTPASIRLSVRCLLAGFTMLVSIPHGHAFTCFASADAVRQENPTAWPSWTMRTPGHEGNKCWYPSTRAAAHEHRNPLEPRTQSIGAKEPFEREVDVTGSATPSDTVQAPDAVTSSSFDDRFSAVGEGGSPDAGSKLQRVIDLFSGPAHGP